MRVCFAITNLLLIAAWNTGGAIHADLVESFPGSGPFAAVGGPSGFDNPGWVVLGTPGSFVANSFGELVYQMGTASVGQDSLNRFGGQTAFSSLLEISNLLVPDSQSGIRFGIVDSANETALIVVQPLPAGWWLTCRPVWGSAIPCLAAHWIWAPPVMSNG